MDEICVWSIRRMTLTEGETCPSAPSPHQITHGLVCDWNLQYLFVIVFFFFFLSFNLDWLAAFHLDLLQAFFSLLYNCQFLCFWRLTLSTVVEVFPRPFFLDIAPSRMFTTNSLCLTLRRLMSYIYIWSTHFWCF